MNEKIGVARPQRKPCAVHLRVLVATTGTRAKNKIKLFGTAPPTVRPTRIASGGDDGRLRWKQLENTRGEGGAIGRLWS